MSTQNNGTDDNQDPNQTGNSNPATGDDGQSSANQTDDQIVLSKEDHQKLVSQRDQNFNKAQTAEEKLAELEAWKAETEAEKARSKFVRGFISENKKKYPHVKKADLMRAESPEEVEEIAQAIETRYEELREQALADIQDVGKPPVLTAEEKEQKLAELRKRAETGEDVFEEMLDLQM